MATQKGGQSHAARDCLAQAGPDGYLPDAAVDLVYLDPPFNSNRDDNVIFRDESGS